MEGRPQAYQGDLLYVLDDFDGRVLSVFTFPGGQVFGKKIKMPVNAAFSPICSDTSGHIFIPVYGLVLEYAHGGRVPIAKLKGFSSQHGCASDPKTGDLAAIESSGSGVCTIAIYKGAKGKPVLRHDSSLGGCLYPTYDNSGNLFVDGEASSGSVLTELPAGSTNFKNISLSHSIPNFWFMQWDGQDIAIMAPELGSQDLPAVVWRFRVVGSKGALVSRVRFKGWTKVTVTQFWIQGSYIVANDGSLTELGVWKYPQGGKALHKFAVPAGIYSFTVSVAP
jgi:hypothetical protein